MGEEALAPGTRFTTDIPGRLDRLPWSIWHTRVVVALGVTWMLDGLEVTLVGSLAPALTDARTLHLSESQIGFAASAYLAGAVAGALLFGRLTDVFGRRRLFFATLGVYLGATFATAFSWNFASFLVTRAVTGAGIGGEYSAVNSAIDELLPARLRGRASLAVNSTYWLGTGLGAASTTLLLAPGLLPPSLGWRFAFALGATLGLVVLVFRRHIPESPRWLLLHGRVAEAREIVTAIEGEVEPARAGAMAGPEREPAVRELTVKGRVTFASIARVLVKRHPRRALLALSLMVAQAFAYNGIFFTYALVLTRFYGVPTTRAGSYLLPFAAANLVGPYVLGSLFDTLGRRPMIVATYAISGALMAVAGLGMASGYLTATSQTVLWCVVFFVASAAASSAYLTVSELFPVELRGMAIALFYAVGTAAGGLGAPALFGALVQTGERGSVVVGYLVGGALMVLAAGVAAAVGVAAERKSLEEIAELAQ